jgi:hypothetical protein
MAKSGKCQSRPPIKRFAFAIETIGFRRYGLIQRPRLTSEPIVSDPTRTLLSGLKRLPPQRHCEGTRTAQKVLVQLAKDLDGGPCDESVDPT